MSISPFIFLIIYVIGVLIFLVLAIVNMYHIVRFGHLRAPSIVTTLAFLVVTVGILISTFNQLKNIEWDEPLSISIPLTNTSSIDEGFE